MPKQRASVTNLEDDVVRKIFAILLAEFRQRGLGSNELHEGYEGLAPARLKEICCSDGMISEVDYDLAIKDMENDDFIKTGPMEMYQNDPQSYVMVIGFVSKREYSYLTEKGYKAATKVKPTRAAGGQNVHISGTFHQSPIGIGNHLSQSISISAAHSEDFNDLRKQFRTQIEDSEKQAKSIQALNALEEAQDNPTRIARYTHLLGILGDHITVFSFLLSPLFQKLMQ